jgi:uncharacterized protein YciI
MLFLVIALDKPGSAGRRAELRGPHLEFMVPRQHRMVFGGPILDDAGRMGGSVMIMNFPDRAALDAHMAEDPYFTGDLYEAVFIRETRQIVPEQKPGGLAGEIAAQRAASS